MYDDEEEEVIEKIKIPKYKIIYTELDTLKKEQPADATNNQNNTEKVTNNASNNDNSRSKEEAKSNFIEKVLECKYFIYFKIDATTSLEGCEFDKDIATKLKRKLDEDPEMNNPSVSNAESKYLK